MIDRPVLGVPTRLTIEEFKARVHNSFAYTNLPPIKNLIDAQLGKPLNPFGINFTRLNQILKFPKIKSNEENEDTNIRDGKFRHGTTKP